MPRALQANQWPMGWSCLAGASPAVMVAVSLAMGLGVTFAPDTLHSFPEMLQTILESGIATGSLFALVLNLVLPKASVPAPTMEALEASNEKLEESNFSR